MPRIYYNKEELSGNSINTNLINLDIFQYIKDNTNKNLIEIPQVNKSFFGILRKPILMFSYVLISRDDFEYKTSEGTFYLPDALIFYDINDAPFPSKFYFIARIKDKIELRECYAGEGVKWFQIPNLHTEISDKSIVTKIENTLKQTQKLVATIYNIETEKNKKKKLEEEHLEKERQKPYISLEEKGAYQKIGEICLADKRMKSEFNDFLDGLKSYDKYETLDSVITYLNDRNMWLIMNLDWKAGVEDLEWSIQSTLKQNFTQSIPLPQAEDMDDNITISHNGVFAKFDNTLRENGLQISLIDTESDEYLLMIHTIERKLEVKEAVNKTGYKYQEVANL
ncbi:hypothetical protein [Dysgonomonas sp. ZJ279]|uniref:DUF6630 family protein n=1 Tax=Dysgonomonas sp. ZJ279 TaxID=2709796 RepID=UPI00162630C5|nr:hypothetical protein [Dysgonomonas sp. ZJ279]